MSEQGSPAWSARTWGLMVGLALTLIPMLVRLQTPLDLVPYWDGDPLSQEIAIMGMTPGKSLAGDLATVIGAAVLIACSPRRGLKPLAPALLIAVGAIGCLYWMRDGTPRQWTVGGAWLSACVGGYALWHAGGDRRVRLAAFALVLGAVGLLAVKGVYQVAIEHPATVEAFKQDRAEIFARNGWSPDSSMARAYERRLMQSEATGWFGFANVFATFAAVGVAGFGVVAAGAWMSVRAAVREREEVNRWPAVLATGGLAISGVALVLAGAKGGFAAAALGLAVAVVLAWMQKTGRGRFAAWLIGPAAIAAPLAAVVARGIVGTRIGELSLLFRWFYMQGAARIFSGHWRHGVGPDGFQAAYSIAKNPLSPEDVTSPHSVMWDWAACLGVAGIAWAAWLVCSSIKVGPSALATEERRQEDDGPAADEPRLLMRAVCLVAAAASMVAIPMQYSALLPEEAIGVRVGGLMVWCILSCAVIAVARTCGAWRIALGAAAVVALAHIQIEITGVWVQSCGLVAAVVGLAASGTGSTAHGNGLLPERAGRWVCVAACAAAAFLVLSPLRASVAWETSLRTAYSALGPIRDLRVRLLTAERNHTPDVVEIARKLRETEPKLITQAVQTLPRTWPTTRSASQLAVQLAAAYRQDDRSDSAARSLAWTVAALELVASPDSADGPLNAPGASREATLAAFGKLASTPATGMDSLSAGWAATVCVAAADGGYPPSERAWRDLAVKYLRQCRLRDPYNPLHAVRLMDVLDRMGLREEAAAAARDVLAVDDLQRLDRAARGLSAGERSRAERIAAGK